jgi:hypothetical protein
LLYHNRIKIHSLNLSPYQIEEKTEEEWLLSSLLAPILLIKDKFKSNLFFPLLFFPSLDVEHGLTLLEQILIPRLQNTGTIDAFFNCKAQKILLVFQRTSRNGYGPQKPYI